MYYPMSRHDMLYHGMSDYVILQCIVVYHDILNMLCVLYIYIYIYISIALSLSIYIYIHY